MTEILAQSVFILIMGGIFALGFANQASDQAVKDANELKEMRKFIYAKQMENDYEKWKAGYRV